MGPLPSRTDRRLLPRPPQSPAAGLREGVGRNSGIEFRAEAGLLGSMDDPMRQRIQKWNRLYWVGWIWLIGFLGMMAEEMVSGLISMNRLTVALIGSAIGSPFLLLVTVPVGALGWLIGSWRPLRRFQLHLSLLLPLLLCAMGPVSIAWDRVFPAERFARFTGVAFPRDAKVENTTYDHGFGPFADRGYEFLFTCTAEETERLTRELKLDRTRRPPDPLRSSRSGLRRPRGWVDHRGNLDGAGTGRKRPLSSALHRRDPDEGANLLRDHLRAFKGVEIFVHHVAALLRRFQHIFPCRYGRFLA